MSTCWERHRDDAYSIHLDAEDERFKETAGDGFRCTISICKRPMCDTWGVWLGKPDDKRVGTNGSRTFLFDIQAASPDDAQENARKSLHLWLDAFGSALFALSRPKRHPLRPVHCAWCSYVGHDCVDGAREDDAEPYDSRQGDNVASSVWQGSGKSRGLRIATSFEDIPGELHKFTFATDTWYVQGHYGSGHFDMALYKFVKNFPTASADPVCDTCVQQRIEAGDLELITVNVL